VAAFRAGALTLDGTVVAIVIGTLVFGAGGWPFAAVLLTFFVTSIALGRVRRARKASLTNIEKAGARDWTQVLANGGVAAACALLSLHGGAGLREAFAGAFAAATADTWGTEIGTATAAVPRSIVTGRRLDPGISGGVTPAGTLGEVAGAATLALVATSLHAAAFLPVLAGGIAGALIDSLLGATAQALYYCRACECYCEADPHVCGANPRLARGFSWFTNDTVNFAATLTGALVAYGVAKLLV